MTKNDRDHNGIQKLTDLLRNHEKDPSPSSVQPSTPLDGGTVGTPKSDTDHHPVKQVSGRKKLVWLLGGALVLFVFLAGLILIGMKAWQVYSSLQVVDRDVSSLEKLNISSLDSASLEQFGPLVDKTHDDIENVRDQVHPWLGWGNALRWVPVYGGDIQYAGDLLELGSDLTLAASQTYETAFPIWQSVHGNQ